MRLRVGDNWNSEVHCWVCDNLFYCYWQANGQEYIMPKMECLKIINPFTFYARYKSSLMSDNWSHDLHWPNCKTCSEFCFYNTDKIYCLQSSFHRALWSYHKVNMMQTVCEVTMADKNWFSYSKHKKLVWPVWRYFCSQVFAIVKRKPEPQYLCWNLKFGKAFNKKNNQAIHVDCPPQAHGLSI